MMQCSPTFVVVYISLLTMTAGFVLTLSSWFAPPINSFVLCVRVIGPSTLIAGFIFMLFACLVCAVKQGKCCSLCYYFILKDRFGQQFTEDPEASRPLHAELETFFKRKPPKSADEISMSSCKLGKLKIVSNVDHSRNLRATSLTELGSKVSSSPRKKPKGYRQLLEEDTMSLSDSHLAGACSFENGGQSLHRSVLNKQSSKHKALRLYRLPQDRSEGVSFEEQEIRNQCNVSDAINCEHDGSTIISPQNRKPALPEEPSALASLGNVSQCMCNCGDSSQVGHLQFGGGSVHSCQDINNSPHHLTSKPLAIQSSTIDDLSQFQGMQTTHLI